MAGLAQPLARLRPDARAGLQLPRSSAQRALRSRSPVLAFSLPRHVAELKEEGPGSGKRHFPEDLHQQYEPRRRLDDGGEKERRHHDMMSTEECYALFPLLTKASVPLRPVEDREPAGLSVLREQDAGPDTGRRHRPAPAGAERARLPAPDTRPTDLRRELLARRAPEQLLQQVVGQPQQGQQEPV